MTNVLISGSRSIKALPDDAIESIDKIIPLGFHIILGDADGIDNLVQRYLVYRKYRKVTVYYASFSGSGKPRNNHNFSTVSVRGNYSDLIEANVIKPCVSLPIMDLRFGMVEVGGQKQIS